MVRGRRVGARRMVKARPIPPAVRDAQTRASNPAASSFVSANAGSGKTHVLVQRVIRLLLEGVPPGKILCITFTKAAAANMAERVFTTLGHWVTLDNAALDAAIKDVGIAHPDRHLRSAARKLFASALETPGGLKVQTIHALCTRLLQQFPFEAAVPARFAVLDERDQAEMMEREPESVSGGRAQSGESDRSGARDSYGERGRRDLQGRGARGLSESRPLHGLDRRSRERGSRRSRDGRGPGRDRQRRDRGHRARDRGWAASAAAAMAGDRGRPRYRQQDGPRTGYLPAGGGGIVR